MVCMIELLIDRKVSGSRLIEAKALVEVVREDIPHPSDDCFRSFIGQSVLKQRKALTNI